MTQLLGIGAASRQPSIEIILLSVLASGQNEACQLATQKTHVPCHFANLLISSTPRVFSINNILCPIPISAPTRVFLTAGPLQRMQLRVGFSVTVLLYDRPATAEYSNHRCRKKPKSRIPCYASCMIICAGHKLP
ncbi:uncharacterized protein BBA_09469 [Beauveria bassiana ARSEF 2860]|uniref:Uncharacterized protein n=1 Tax=Beauveria bassiana (strain ARSEF 2860) TaxID=655819 RepID=J4KL44_BEAB2|nr:uncharacterized protein BBA_09469 [Beauveria bassiana ARSEF 2860]EJP61559.1 hypothetical protein BBA_09469 [Beauveria bassiana ARSEF 2860]